MKRFTLLIPTRERVISLYQLFVSLRRTTTFPERVFSLIKYDEDDKDSMLAITSLRRDFKEFIIGDFHSSRSDYLNRDYYNYLAQYSNGANYLWAIGDDVRFLTKGWDEILERKIEEYLQNKKDRIAYIETGDGTEAKHCCFPIITKEAYEATGMFFHPEIMTWGADRTLAELYQGVNRILNVPEVQLDHISYHDRKAPIDSVALKVKERFFRNPNCHNEVSSTIVPKQIEELKRKIENG